MRASCQEKRDRGESTQYYIGLQYKGFGIESFNGNTCFVLREGSIPRLKTNMWRGRSIDY